MICLSVAVSLYSYVYVLMEREECEGTLHLHLPLSTSVLQPLCVYFIVKAHGTTYVTHKIIMALINN